MVSAMRTLIIGIDSGTQSTKALVVDANTGKVLASGRGAGLRADTGPAAGGEGMQHPQWRRGGGERDAPGAAAGAGFGGGG